MKYHGFKKKVKKKKPESSANVFLVSGLLCGRKGPELYVETFDRLWIYVSTKFKNYSNEMSEELKVDQSRGA